MHSCLARHLGFVKVSEGINGHGSVIDEEAKMASSSSGGEFFKSSSLIVVPLKPTNVEGSIRRGLRVEFGSNRVQEPEVMDYEPPRRKPPIHNRKSI
ncbi:hypothetical protein M5689_017680 [Euphorbia peplus]|nr:hypothetical protein M5689_017680 [Euphorbia peplus]